MRAAGSQLVVDTIESALRQGGLALFDEGFQIDSSLNWVFGENIEGEVDAVVPLWSGGGHAVFVQPGFVFWTGLADEERIDGNLGIAYRTGLTKDVIGGASIFYDRDFKQGHSRVSFGADVQSGFLHGAANYYQPLSDEEDGREGFVEEALRGMDFRLAFQRDVMRVSGNLGYWRFEGDDTVEADWKISYGLDAGVRIFPGVFLEGGWERHDEDVSIDSRWNAGLAFRFSLPDFKGASYGDGSMSSNLYQVVDREKRILYEERVAGPSVSIALGERESGNLEEGSTVSIQVQLDRVLGEDVTLNLIGSGTATYGEDGDWVMSVGGMNCASIAGTGCQAVISAGETTYDAVVVSINEDGRGESSETIILSMEIASADDTSLMLGNSRLVLAIDEDPPLPSVSLSAANTGITEGATEVLTITLSETVSEDITLNLIGSGTATYGTSNDWYLHNGTSDCDSVSGMSCQVTISAGSTTIARGANISVFANTDSDSESPPETAIVSVEVDSGSANLVQAGSQSSLTFTIEDPPPPTVSFNYGGSMTVQENGLRNGVVMTLELSEALGENVTVNLVGRGMATYSRNFNAGDWSLRYRVVAAGGTASSNAITDDFCLGVTGTACQFQIPAGSTIVDVHLQIYSIGQSAAEPPEDIILSVEIASAGSTGLTLGSPSSVELTITK